MSVYSTSKMVRKGLFAVKRSLLYDTATSRYSCNGVMNAFGLGSKVAQNFYFH